jgi:queuine tRNA-ribosyltransferase subunit QTRTD1
LLQGGSIPHLTYEVLQMVTKEQHALHIPISTIAHCHEAVVAFKKGIADFIGLKVLLSYLFFYSASVQSNH